MQDITISINQIANIEKFARVSVLTDVIDRLKNLKRIDGYASGWKEDVYIDWQEDKYGDYVEYIEIRNLIEELEILKNNIDENN